MSDEQNSNPPSTPPASKPKPAKPAAKKPVVKAHSKSEQKRLQTQMPDAEVVHDGDEDRSDAVAPVARMPRRFNKQAVEHTEDTFKLTVSKMKKNFSFVWREPRITELEHCHIFHSINDTTLQPNKYCSPVGGHFHECTPVVDGDGNLTLKVGPPLHWVNRKVSGGRTVRRAVPVSYERHLGDHELSRYEGDGEKAPDYTLIKDEHTHGVEYIGSETFTMQSKHQARQQEQAKVKGVSAGEPVSLQATSQTRLVSGPEAERLKANIQETTAPRKDGSDAGAA